MTCFTSFFIYSHLSSRDFSGFIFDTKTIYPKNVKLKLDKKKVKKKVSLAVSLTLSLLGKTPVFSG